MKKVVYLAIIILGVLIFIISFNIDKHADRTLDKVSQITGESWNFDN